MRTQGLSKSDLNDLFFHPKQPSFELGLNIMKIRFLKKFHEGLISLCLLMHTQSCLRFDLVTLFLTGRDQAFNFA